MTKLTHCYGVIPFTEKLSEEIQYLCIKQINSPSWSFPKGHPESTEGPIDTALRELKEEVNIQARIIPNFFYEYEYELESNDSSNIIQKTVTLFLGKAESTAFAIQQSEIETAAWLPAPKALKLITFTAIQKALEKAEEHIKNKYFA